MTPSTRSPPTQSADLVIPITASALALLKLAYPMLLFRVSPPHIALCWQHVPLGAEAESIDPQYLLDRSSLSRPIPDPSDPNSRPEVLFSASLPLRPSLPVDIVQAIIARLLHLAVPPLTPFTTLALSPSPLTPALQFPDPADHTHPRPTRVLLRHGQNFVAYYPRARVSTELGSDGLGFSVLLFPIEPRRELRADRSTTDYPTPRLSAVLSTDLIDALSLPDLTTTDAPLAPSPQPPFLSTLYDRVLDIVRTSGLTPDQLLDFPGPHGMPPRDLRTLPIALDPTSAFSELRRHADLPPPSPVNNVPLSRDERLNLRPLPPGASHPVWSEHPRRPVYHYTAPPSPFLPVPSYEDLADLVQYMSGRDLNLLNDYIRDVRFRKRRRGQLLTPWEVQQNVVHRDSVEDMIRVIRAPVHVRGRGSNPEDWEFRAVNGSDTLPVRAFTIECPAPTNPLVKPRVSVHLELGEFDIDQIVVADLVLPPDSASDPKSPDHPSNFSKQRWESLEPTILSVIEMARRLGYGLVPIVPNLPDLPTPRSPLELIRDLQETVGTSAYEKKYGSHLDHLRPDSTDDPTPADSGSDPLDED